KRAYCLKTQPATGETYPKSDLFNKASETFINRIHFFLADFKLAPPTPSIQSPTLADFLIPGLHVAKVQLP
ncbi:hypothetical protein QSU81_15005, partial [Klebsiella pneumoniae]